MKKRFPYWSAITILGCLGVGVTASSATLLTVINQSFLFSLFLLIAGGLAAVVRSGFFSVFAAGFRQLKQMFFRKPRVLDEDLYQTDDPSFQSKKETFFQRGTSLLIEAGLSLALFSIGLTITYYLK
ncbi:MULTISPECIES: DUF3899 domain-containing protein [Brevibacillus]|uniref:DUF3899 domain-containing protein n=1 Tax=Brevibacillus invocatus TaxID=173959 RepID=A0A3M8C309_9BACL|nr:MULTISPECIES: DUF3899 domain-containing protein [Brevibacillus]MDH4617578.1 DUF3899 domain-containing protein [Brevibacillus sp. AY1]RNB70090.1 DUF3899 domain-containing protein [Brevibacillus invocatus]